MDGLKCPYFLTEGSANGGNTIAETAAAAGSEFFCPDLVLQYACDAE